jgi:hypothetical protein
MQADRIEDSWRPSWGRGVTDEGNVDEARQEMARSRYDRDGDGRCDGEMCSFQVPIQPVQSIASASRPLLVAALAQLGIRIELVHVGEGDFWSMATSPAARLPLVPDFGWLPDYPNPSAFVVPLLYGESIRARQNFDVSLLGATPARLRRWGYATTSVPSADARIERCLAMTGDAQAWCWTELDAYLMEAIVPVVPIGTVDHSWLLSPQVASFSVDQSTDLPAYDRVALAPGAGGTS